VKVVSGYGFPKSRNVGCEREVAANFAEATMPQTVAVSPTWVAASSGLTVAALVEIAHRLNNTDAANDFNELSSPLFARG
jgi:hypothetical protein